MSNLVPRNQPAALEKVKENNGSVSVLTAVERKLYYLEMCRAYQFDPLSFPFDYIESDGKLKLYINSVGASQLRDRFGISIYVKSREFLEDMWIVTVEAKRGDRTEEATGAASIVDKYGKTTPDRKANALKKAETQARRRATLAICGFGWDDEESGTIIRASVYDPPEDVVITPLPPSNEEVWRNWKTPEDAIAWAVTQLPDITPEQLRQEFNNLSPSNGKKAPAWVQRVIELKEPF
ncbi:hypothetical protein B4U84_29710 [Westiellopsis prolifica IICB1]|nr:hypothetical protein B4U84_29710 [Westiellopsis prolifica IICB1]